MTHGSGQVTHPTSSMAQALRLKAKARRASVRIAGARFFGGLAGALMLAATQAAIAQSWPNRPIKLIVPYAAGQGTDIVARYVADEVGKELNQPIIIDNRPGAGGNIGTQVAAKSQPDGYTIVIGTNATHAANAFLYSKLGFDAQADFEPVAMVGLYPMVYVTHPSNPISNMQELQRAAKLKPEGLNIAISATTYRMAYELFKSRTGAALFPVDFKSSGQALTAVVGGQVEYMVDSIAGLRGSIQSQQVKPLGVTSATTSRLLPNVKSLAEQGIAGYELTGWSVIFMPKGVPPEALRTLSAALDKVLAKPAVQDKLLQLGIEPKTMPRGELRKFVAEERDKWGHLIQGAGLKPAN